MTRSGAPDGRTDDPMDTDPTSTSDDRRAPDADDSPSETQHNQDATMTDSVETSTITPAASVQALSEEEDSSMASEPAVHRAAVPLLWMWPRSL